ncbi:MAG: hypothetical protein RL329_3041 [Bacteroidota bacterium]
MSVFDTKPFHYPLNDEKMNHLNAFNAQIELKNKYVGNAHLIWTMGLYLNNANFAELASECLIDGPDDRESEPLIKIASNVNASLYAVLSTMYHPGIENFKQLII